MRIMDWSSDVCSSVLSFRNQHKRSLHWLGSRVILRTLLNTDKYINLKIDESRKPFLASLPHQVSISPSYDFAAVMVIGREWCSESVCQTVYVSVERV